MSPLSFYAGPKALAHIKQHGFTPDMFSAVLGASGGPKWFVLTGLDKILFNDFMHKSTNHIDIIGSSVGAFRASCFAQDDPGAAISRLAEGYSNTVYSEKPSVQEITQKGLVLLGEMMGENGVEQVLNCVNKTVHIVVARCHGLTAYESKLKQYSGLMLAALRNFQSREQLNKSFTRVVFTSSNKAFSFSEKHKFTTENVQLNESNFLTSLMASGSIPAVIEGVKDINGAKPGMFRDGGIIDYHFDMQIETSGLVLYPHFYSKPTPGWFDKSLKSRSCHEASYDNVLMLAPSDNFVAKLPYGKIPDRNDFRDLPAQERIKYWSTVIDESDRLADAFLDAAQKQSLEGLVQPINLKR